MPTSTTCTFPSPRGFDLSARLELPDPPLRATVVFAHCFTCSKDHRVERQLTAALTAQGFAVLSFDFAGLGRSGGEFGDDSFAADVEDIAAAADYLAENYTAPSLLVGHSLGGAAVLSAAPAIPSVTAVASIAAPADPQHVQHLLDGDLDAVRSAGSGRVTIAGRSFTISHAFIEQLEQASPRHQLASYRGASLFLHSPVDDLVGIDNAEQLYRAARHPKSFVSLDRADHLLTDPAAAGYAATVIAAWASQYLPPTPEPEPTEAGATARNSGGLATTITARGFRLTADEPAGIGTGLGPTPYDYLSTALAACTTMTMRMYADRKGWDVGDLEATVGHDRVHADDCADCETREGHIERFDRVLRLPDGLTDAQRAGLIKIANRCPVHRTLEGRIEVQTRVAD